MPFDSRRLRSLALRRVDNPTQGRAPPVVGPALHQIAEITPGSTRQLLLLSCFGLTHVPQIFFASRSAASRLPIQGRSEFGERPDQKSTLLGHSAFAPGTALLAPFRSLPGTGADGSRGDLPEIGTADRTPLQQWSEEEAFVGGRHWRLDCPLA